MALPHQPRQPNRRAQTLTMTDLLQGHAKECELGPKGVLPNGLRVIKDPRALVLTRVGGIPYHPWWGGAGVVIDARHVSAYRSTIGFEAIFRLALAARKIQEEMNLEQDERARSKLGGKVMKAINRVGYELELHGNYNPTNAVGMEGDLSTEEHAAIDLFIEVTGLSGASFKDALTAVRDQVREEIVGSILES